MLCIIVTMWAQMHCVPNANYNNCGKYIAGACMYIVPSFYSWCELKKVQDIFGRKKEEEPWVSNVTSAGLVHAMLALISRDLIWGKPFTLPGSKKQPCELTRDGGSAATRPFHPVKRL